MPAALASILPMPFPPVARGAHRSFLEGLVSDGQYLLIAYYFSSLAFPVVLVPHMGQRMSTSLGLPMNFSFNFSGGIKLISPQAHAGHSA